ncbi:MAG: peptidoglycan-binding protein [Ruminococcus sp.]|nr:peptidoglycan-binding protein [Ruminococcus sp.]
MKQFTKRFITMVLSLFVIMSSIPFTNSVLPNLIPLNQITAEAANYRSDYWTFPVPTRNLKKISPNQRGNDVKWFQSAINNLITNGDRSNSKLSIAKLDVDGVFGTASRNATITFQKKYNLSADGIFGPASRAKMQAVLKPRNTSHTHNYVLQKTVAATCGNYGYKEYRCSCGLTQKTLTTNPTSNHNYQFQRIGLNLNAKCSNCNYEEKAISYQRYLTITKKIDNMTTYCEYLRSRGHIDLANIYAKAGLNANVFIYYTRVNTSDKAKSFSEECNSMIRISKGLFPRVYKDSNIVKIQVALDTEFVDAWNNLIPSGARNIHMLLHGNATQLCFHNVELSYSQICQLQKKFISNKVYLYSCFGAGEAITGYRNTPAKAFRYICQNGDVIACADSGVNYTGSADPLIPTWIDTEATYLFNEGVNGITMQFEDKILYHFYPVIDDLEIGQWITYKSDGTEYRSRYFEY